jgi:hypothetical protein
MRCEAIILIVEVLKRIIVIFETCSDPYAPSTFAEGALISTISAPVLAAKSRIMSALVLIGLRYGN